MGGVVIVGAAGRMGRTLVKCVLESGDLRLVGAVERPGHESVGEDAGAIAGLRPCGVPIVDDIARCVAGADAAVDFSTGGVVENARKAVAAGAACVIGATALPAEDKAALASLAQSGARIVHAPNMSVGVNLLFQLTAMAARVLGESFDIEIVEMHHNQKKDSPSGTAARLLELAARERGLDPAAAARHGRLGLVGARGRGEIGVHALRGGDVVGDHTVVFAADGERLELTHKASSRETFARGALRAARFLASAPPGLYDMADVLGLRA